jgi:hypothetical protein
MNTLMSDLPRVFITGTPLAGCNESVRAILKLAQSQLNFPATPYSDTGGWDIQFSFGSISIRAKTRTSRVYDPIRDAEADGRFRDERDFLKIADGIIFVADSQVGRLDANLHAIELLRDLIIRLGRDPSNIPLVFQLNKQDLPNLLPPLELMSLLQWPQCKHVLTIATTGAGIGLVIDNIIAMIHR